MLLKSNSRFFNIFIYIAIFVNILFYLELTSVFAQSNAIMVFQINKLAIPVAPLPPPSPPIGRGNNYSLPLGMVGERQSNYLKNYNQKSKNLLFKFYSDYISPVDGERCGMYPSCSGYGEEAIKKHGLFMGWIISCDRLIRCGRDEVNISKRVKQPDGKLLTLDPLESNDFWWYPYAPSD